MVYMYDAHWVLNSRYGIKFFDYFGNHGNDNNDNDESHNDG